MSEALSTYDTLVLEKKWITQDPKIIAFALFIFKVLALLHKYNGKKDSSDSKDGKSKKKKNQSKGNKSKYKKDEFKYVALKARESYKKEVNSKKYYYYDKLYGPDRIPMWILHKSVDHKDHKKKLKKEKVELEL